jgi:hypothetical protein
MHYIANIINKVYIYILFIFISQDQKLSIAKNNLENALYIDKHNLISYVVIQNDVETAKKILDLQNEKYNDILLTNIIKCNKPLYESLKEYGWNVAFNDTHLELACEYTNIFFVSETLNNKTKPTQKAYQNLFKKTFHQLSHNVNDIFEYFYVFDYKFTYEDILLATKYRYTLQKKYITEPFIPTEEFYKYCDINFFPKYNEDIVHNIFWVKMMLKNPKLLSCNDINHIHKIIEKNKIKLDDETKNKIRKEIKNSKTKDKFVEYIANN